jgi:splicing factor U2AF 65 kDa subunit
MSGRGGGGGGYHDRRSGGGGAPYYGHYHQVSRGGGGDRSGGGYYNDAQPPFRPGGGGGYNDGGGRGGGGGYNDGGGRGGGYGAWDRDGGGPPNSRRRKAVPPNVIVFNSLHEEREWVAERRRKRQARKSRFDVTPQDMGLPFVAPLLALDPNASSLMSSMHSPYAQASPQQLLYSDPSHASSPYYGGGGVGQQANMGLPLQTRHARRLYVGNLPLQITEDQILKAFREAIHLTLQPGPGVNVHDDDPILSVYINHERRFCFLEFKTVELCSACMALDGLEVVPGQPPVKVKRPNDYIPSQAPPELFKPVLDLTKLGIISPTVLDGPNKIFIGGLHYHLQDNQVLELLQAFGKVKAFHLVKNEPDTSLSKGYCFVEYADPAVTAVAVAGLNGMDIGGGKSLTARLAGERGGMAMPMPAVPPPLPPPSPASASGGFGTVPGHDKTIVAGYDVEALVDAAMGQGHMPAGPTYFDAYQQPLTRVMPILPFATVARPPPPPPVVAAAATPAPAPLNTMVSSSTTATPAAPPKEATRVLVLLNMVTDEDLATEEGHQGLVDEVREECAKFGVLNDIIIPREVGNGVEASALRKVFLLYASTRDALQAEKELTGRQFGSNVVDTLYYPEQAFIAGLLR